MRTGEGKGSERIAQFSSRAGIAAEEVRTCAASPASKMLLACSEVMFVSSPLESFDSATPTSAAPTICTMVVIESITMKTGAACASAKAFGQAYSGN